MAAPPRLQYTSVRTRVVDGQVVIGLKHTGKDGEGAQVKLPWIEPPEDLARLINTLQQVMDGVGPGPEEIGSSGSPSTRGKLE
ncbi:hypothetical protein LJR039_005443 [Pseudorhodoferax sp. LjRoot39]|uniref:hypothetical protein n=1 Tax=Pseudorhodoferax sp. LjRoot39 TaxID=3342328 RepID=UPI003ECE21EF